MIHHQTFFINSLHHRLLHLRLLLFAFIGTFAFQFTLDVIFKLRRGLMALLFSSSSKGSSFLSSKASLSGKHAATFSFSLAGYPTPPGSPMLHAKGVTNKENQQ